MCGGSGTSPGQGPAPTRSEERIHRTDDGGTMPDGSVRTTRTVGQGSVPEQSPPPAPIPPNVWQRTFAALKYPNYRLWFRGQLVSLVGTWMQLTAQGFLVFQLTQSTAYLGYVGFAAG